jgi:hypothetical protein
LGIALIEALAQNIQEAVSLPTVALNNAKAASPAVSPTTSSGASLLGGRTTETATGTVLEFSTAKDAAPMTPHQPRDQRFCFLILPITCGIVGWFVGICILDGLRHCRNTRQVFSKSHFLQL